jgi:hypothetical protein
MVFKKETINHLYSCQVRIGLIILTLIFVGALVTSAFAEDTTNSVRAQISVTSVTLDPQVFEPYDTGTLTCEIKNNGQTSVPIDRVTIYDKDILLTSKEYDTTAWIGPGESRTLTFTIRAQCGDGTYYPIISVNTRETGSIRYPVRLKVDNTAPVVSIQQKPDTYTTEKKEKIALAVSNPRDNEIKNLHLTPSGDGVDLSPTDSFIGSLKSGETREVSFEVTPTVETNLTFTLEYSNGENDHKTSRTIPLFFGYDKKQADPFVSNVIVKQEKNGYHITGDVTNAGMENAVSVVVTTTGKAVPVYPYKNYVVGTLKPDDFSSFELTFNTNGTEVIPIEIKFKDDDGNQYTRTTDLDLTHALKQDENNGSNSILFVIVIFICLGGGILIYIYRKRILPGVFR